MSLDAQKGGSEEIEKRVRELSELLYLKQTQLEKAAGEKAALEMRVHQQQSKLQDSMKVRFRVEM